MEHELIPEHIIQSVSKVLEQIAMNSKLRNPEPNRNVEAERRRIQARALYEGQGKDAFTNLENAKRISVNDAETIARNLYPEVEKLKKILRQKGDGLGEFCIKAGLAQEGEYSKVLYRLTVGPEQDPKITRPYRTAHKYRQLIEAISDLTKESVGLIADRAVIGSSLHPKNVTEWNETQRVHAILQRVTDDVDRQFGLWEKFMHVAELKAAHVASGGRIAWPFEVLYSDELDQKTEEYKHKVTKASDPSHAYWWNHRDSPVFGYDEDTWLYSGQSHMVIDESVFYLPHAFFGKLDPDDGYGQEAGDLMGWVPHDRWDDINKTPLPEPMPSNNPEDYMGYDDWWNFNTWLMMYPSPTERRLIPILFMPSWGGAVVEILDPRTLDSLRNRQWIGPGRTMAAFDRIQELLGIVPDSDELSENQIRSSLVRTAPWFDFNPFYQLKHNKEARDASLERLFNREMNW
jgi:hypothetical protein